MGPFNTLTPDAAGNRRAKHVFGEWLLVSKGPDGSNAPLPVGFADGNSQNDWLWQLYDPTNGTISTGDVIRGQAGDANAAGYRYVVNY